jgi:hypothetical protein
MKKPCRIDAPRAVKQLESIAAGGNPGVPIAEMWGRTRQGAGPEV